MSITNQNQGNDQTTASPYAEGIPLLTVDDMRAAVERKFAGFDAAGVCGAFAFFFERTYGFECSELKRAGAARKAVNLAEEFVSRVFDGDPCPAVHCVAHAFTDAKKKAKQNPERPGEPLRPSWVFTSRSADVYRAHLTRSGQQEPIGLDREDDEPRSERPRRPLDGRPEVIVRPGDLHLLVDAALRLIATDPEVYVRGDRLVTVSDGRIVPLTKEGARVRLNAAAAWREERIKGEELELIPVDCPKDVSNAVFFAGAWPGARELVGVVDTPLLRPDGTILQAPGYDPATRVLYQPKISFPEIPDEPTDEEARAALDRLLDLFVDFRYRDQDERAVPVSAILTAIGRSGVDGPVPGFVFDAAEQNSGKTLHLGVISTIATGDRPAATAWGDSVEEQRKCFAGWARDGARLVVADNQKTGGLFGSEILDMHFTSTRVNPRILGQTGQPEYEWRGVVLVSANNIRIKQETARRVLVVRLMKSSVAEPDRSFAHDLTPHGMIPRRPALVADALTVLRRHAMLKRPRAAGTVFHSFEEWQRVVGDAIVTAGGPDPSRFRASFVAEQTEADPDMAALVSLVRAWPELVRDQNAPTTARDLARRIWADPEDVGTDRETLDGRFALSRCEGVLDLGDTLLDAVGIRDPRDGAAQGPLRLGKWLGKIKERTIPGSAVFDEDHDPTERAFSFRFVGKKNRAGLMCWSLEKVGGHANAPIVPF